MTLEDKRLRAGADGDGPGGDVSCAEGAARLTALERAAGDAHSAISIEPLEAHARRCATCRARHGRRLDAVRSLCALRGRGLPQGWLDGLGDRVLEDARAAPAGRYAHGGMSPAFLDAPRALQRWRQLALAASLLLAVGSGLVMSGRLGGPREGSRGAGDDPRDGLLERFDVRRRADVVSEGLTPVSFYPGRGLPDYWHGDPASAEAARRAAQNLVGRGRREANADKGD